jgi:hypothetical protein
MADSKPISVTRVASGSYSGPDPKPLVIVGDAVPAVPATFADLAAVRTYLASLVDVIDGA